MKILSRFSIRWWVCITFFVSLASLVLATISLQKKGFFQSSFDFTRKIELQQNPFLWMNLSGGVVVVSFVLALFLFYAKVKSKNDLYKIKSPSKQGIFILANLAWVLLLPSTFLYYNFRMYRRDYAMYSDSIGIPMYYQTVAVLFFLIPLNVFFILSTYSSEFPVFIFQKNKQEKSRRGRNIVLWAFFCLNQLVFISLLLDGDHLSLVVNMIFSYLLLCLIAAKKNIS